MYLLSVMLCHCDKVNKIALNKYLQIVTIDLQMMI